MGYNHQPPHVGLTKHGEGSILSRSGPLLVLLTTYFHHLLVALSPTDINAQPLLQYLYTLPWNPSKTGALWYIMVIDHFWFKLVPTFCWQAPVVV